MNEATAKAQLVVLNLTNDLDGVFGVVPKEDAVEIHVKNTNTEQEVNSRIESLTDQERAVFDGVDITYSIGE